MALLLLPCFWAFPETKAAAAEKVESQFVQVCPARDNTEGFVRSRGQRRAVILIHGYWLHFNKDRVPRVFFKDWQAHDSLLVSTLGKEADVFAFAYGQNAPVEEIARLPGLRGGIARLKKMGYDEVILVGHSAGGLVARLFVEDFPRAGVTKVVQVCAPNGGCAGAEIQLIPKNHKPFVASLSIAARQKSLQERADKKIPTGVEFVCLITAEDNLVPCKCQWTADLMDQGVPEVTVSLGHRQVMRKGAGVKKIAEIIRERQPRWDAGHVAKARRALFKTADQAARMK